MSFLSDSLLYLVSVFTAMMSEKEAAASEAAEAEEAAKMRQQRARQKPVLNVHNEEEMLPDIADAMEDLISEEKRRAKSKSKDGKSEQQQVQRFLFSDEKKKGDSSPDDEDDSMEEIHNASSEDFEIIEEDGKGGSVKASSRYRTPLIRKRIRPKRRGDSGVTSEDFGRFLNGRNQRLFGKSDIEWPDKDAEKPKKFAFRLALDPISLSCQLFGGQDFGVCTKTSMAVDSSGVVLMGKKAHNYEKERKEKEGKFSEITAKFHVLFQ